MDSNDYNEIVDLHSDALFRFILRQVRDRDEAKDVVQDAFLRLWMNVDRVDASKARSYLFTTAKNLVVDRVRRRKFVVRHESWHDDRRACLQPEAGVQAIVDQAMNKLPVHQRGLIQLREVEGLSYKELATRTGMDMTRVKVYLCRARKAVQAYIGDPALVV
jgi:RNA polymerase sigma-70 factor (ECF subfamily)